MLNRVMLAVLMMATFGGAQASDGAGPTFLFVMSHERSLLSCEQCENAFLTGLGQCYDRYEFTADRERSVRVCAGDLMADFRSCARRPPNVCRDTCVPDLYGLLQDQSVMYDVESLLMAWLIAECPPPSE